MQPLKEELCWSWCLHNLDKGVNVWKYDRIFQSLKGLGVVSLDTVRYLYHCKNASHVHFFDFEIKDWFVIIINLKSLQQAPFLGARTIVCFKLALHYSGAFCEVSLCIFVTMMNLEFYGIKQLQVECYWQEGVKRKAAPTTTELCMLLFIRPYRFYAIDYWQKIVHLAS